jgi:hypothetical protein
VAKVEQKYLIDSEVLEHLLSMLRDGVARGATDKEIWEQTREILDPEYRTKTDQALREKAEGRVKRFKDTKEMLDDLHSR